MVAHLADPARRPRSWRSSRSCAPRAPRTSRSSRRPARRWPSAPTPPSCSTTSTSRASCRPGSPRRPSPCCAPRSARTSDRSPSRPARCSPRMRRTAYGPLVGAEQVTFLGRGWTNGIANEAALKLRESAQFWSESYPAMEYRHGPISIAAPGRAVWAFGEVPEGLREQVRGDGRAVRAPRHRPARRPRAAAPAVPRQGRRGRPRPRRPPQPDEKHRPHLTRTPPLERPRLVASSDRKSHGSRAFARRKADGLRLSTLGGGGYVAFRRLGRPFVAFRRSAEGEELHQAGGLVGDGGACRAEVLPRVDRGGRSSRSVIARVKTWLRCVAMLTFVMPARTAATRPVVGHPGRAVQHERHRDRAPQGRNEIRVELCRAVRHRVTAAHGHGERIDARVGDEARRVRRIGAHAGRVDAVLAADLAELGLDRDPGRAAQPDDPTRRRRGSRRRAASTRRTSPTSGRAGPPPRRARRPRHGRGARRPVGCTRRRWRASPPRSAPGTPW